ncbi:GNAT family N-acetyltransferase [Candidatus Izemoplasma sp. B36]|uniref:GNAT family N-acetyltransferase n=1 Tax=Candidatus Izemoplasma sp. B36 TaxID=3242468 RepID=UPI0035570BDE
MIRKLTEQDRDFVLEYLYKDLNYNIFPIGDIETYGFNNPIQVIYGEFDNNDNYLSIFLRYRNNGIYYSHKKRFNKEFLEIFKKEKFDFFSGKSELTDLIKPYLKNFNPQREYFCKADKINYSKEINDSFIKELRNEEDCGRLYDLLFQVKEFQIFRQTKESFVKGKMASLKMGKTLYIEEDNKIVASVAVTAETTINAMVVAVATDPDYRNRGYATSLLVKLMKIYIEEKKKELCLFYDNPKAGKIYLRLGFKNIGTWDLYRRKIT